MFTKILFRYKYGLSKFGDNFTSTDIIYIQTMGWGR